MADIGGVAMVSAETPLKIARAPTLLTSRRVGGKIAIVCYRRTFYWRNSILLPLKSQLWRSIAGCDLFFFFFGLQLSARLKLHEWNLKPPLKISRSATGAFWHTTACTMHVSWTNHCHASIQCFPGADYYHS